MPFNLLLANYLNHGTSFKESGVEVSIKPNNDETFLFFNIDYNKNRHQFNEYMKIADTGETICDLLIYHLNYASNEPKKAICLVELKGTDSKHAVQQLLNTYEMFNKNLRRGGQFQDAKWGAFIMTHKRSSVVKNTKPLLKLLSDKGLKPCIAKKGFDTFIRGLV